MAERPESHADLIAAAHHLYGSLHLPRPAVVVVPSGTEFARLVVALARPGRPPPFLALMLALYVLFALALTVLGLVRFLQGELPTSDVAIFGLVSLIIACMTALLLRRPPAPILFAPVVYACAVLLGAMSGLFMGGISLAVLAAAHAGALAALAHLVLVLTLPVRRRLAARRRFRAALPLLGARPLHDVLAARLRAAADELPQLDGVRDRARPMQAARERPEVATRVDAEGESLADYHWRALRPLLGAGSSDPTRHVLRRAAGRVGSRDDLPALLRAALALDAISDAVAVLDRVVVVLPADSLGPTGVAGQRPMWAWRRSKRATYRQVLTILENGVWPGLGVDLVWSDHLADRLLASYIRDLPNAVVRHAAIRAMGLERFVAAAGLKPVQADTVGELYLVGPPSDPLAFVRVLDATPGPDGEPKPHWLSVPPHVATAREAIAWSFGLPERAYAPAAET